MSDSEERPANAESREAGGTLERRTKVGVWLAMGGLFAWEFLKSFVRPGAKEPQAAAMAEAVPQGSAAKAAAGLAEAARDVGHLVTEIAAMVPTTEPPKSPEFSNVRAEAVEDAEDETRRNQDRNLDAEAGVNLARRQSRGTALAGLALLTAFAGGVTFLVAYWISASNLLLGGSLAVALGGAAAALVIWARWLTIQREAVEPRKPLCPPPEERAAAAEAFFEGAQDIQRRSLLRWAVFAGAGFAAAAGISLLRSIGFPSYGALNTRVWKRGQRLVTEDGKPVAANSLEAGATLIVFPEDSIGSERAQTVLLRVDQQLLQLPAARESWAPLGNLAFSRVCTHAGCTVGMYEKTAHLLMCPCHQSTFDVLRAARPNGGPAARALPQLPLYADGDGNLRAGGGFSEPPGPGFWGME